MGAGHQHGLYRPGATRLHRAPAQCKVAATLLFVFAVVTTPREAFWAYAAYAAILAALAAAARLPLPFLARRWLFELPFIGFAVFLPLVGGGPRVDVAGVGSVSVEGLWAAWNIIAKATLGVTATVVLAATTPVPDLLRGLERLRVPRAFTTVAAFMVRYAEVIGAEMRRMAVARRSRGHDPRWLWQARAVAASAGALFIRSYERGERVYLAMVARGYGGAMPVLDDRPAAPGQWAAALAVPALAVTVAAAAWGTA